MLSLSLLMGLVVAVVVAVVVASRSPRATRTPTTRPFGSLAWRGTRPPWLLQVRMRSSRQRLATPLPTAQAIDSSGDGLPRGADGPFASSRAPVGICTIPGTGPSTETAGAGPRISMPSGHQRPRVCPLCLNKAS